MSEANREGNNSPFRFPKRVTTIQETEHTVFFLFPEAYADLIFCSKAFKHSHLQSGLVYISLFAKKLITIGKKKKKKKGELIEGKCNYLGAVRNKREVQFSILR